MREWGEFALRVRRDSLTDMAQLREGDCLLLRPVAASPVLLVRELPAHYGVIQTLSRQDVLRPVGDVDHDHLRQFVETMVRMERTK